jgi:hypothetical protein
MRVPPMATGLLKGRQPGLFARENVVVKDGSLQLWARAARRNASWPAGYDNYTTATVRSAATVREGLFEIRWRSGSSGHGRYCRLELMPLIILCRENL